MLLTLRVSALKSRIAGPIGTAASGGKMALLDVPKFAREELGVNGLILGTELLVGADRPQLQKVIEAADKAGCPCLVLMESTPQQLAHHDLDKVNAAQDRCLRVAQAAAWLGCAAFSIPLHAEDDDSDLVTAATNIRPISRRAEKLDLNLCIAPGAGLTATPDRITELLKKIGGFRVGTLPDFQAAAVSPDPVQYLRRLVPYASGVLVPVPDDKDLQLAMDGGGDDLAPPRPVVKKPAKKSGMEALLAALSSAEPLDDEEDEEEEAPPPVKKGSAKPPKETKAKRGKKGEPAEKAESAEDGPAVPPVPASLGPGYNLLTFLGILRAVGYEGPLALDDRHSGDPVPRLLKLRDVIVAKFAPPVREETDGISALLAGGGEGEDFEDEEEGDEKDE
ncbi:MAG: sugar phosphate isomerase/epimerase family protein [Phycisphaerales bacterium]